MSSTLCTVRCRGFFCYHRHKALSLSFIYVKLKGLPNECWIDLYSSCVLSLYRTMMAFMSCMPARSFMRCMMLSRL